ncbi:MAG: FkbM family methyltransferase [Steroidobacteraceae bacterium]
MTPNTLMQRMKRCADDARTLMTYGNGYSSLRYFVNSIFRRRMPQRVTLAGESIIIRSKTHDLEVALSCLRDGEFAPAISASKSRHRLIVDAGGYIGTAAIAFARAFPDSTVVTLEPSTTNFPLLAENVRPYKNIVPLQKALSNRDGQIELFDRKTGDWGFTTIKQANESGSVIECISVPTLLKSLNRTGIDILKLDIEGGEKPLLESNTEWLDNVDLVIAELHERIAAGCTDIFYAATNSMREVFCGGEKIMVVRH